MFMRFRLGEMTSSELDEVSTSLNICYAHSIRNVIFGSKATKYQLLNRCIREPIGHYNYCWSAGKPLSNGEGDVVVIDFQKKKKKKKKVLPSCHSTTRSHQLIKSKPFASTK
jgi:hypothetical protein